MGNLYDYFAASDDESATVTFHTAPDPTEFRGAADQKASSPFVQLGTLEALLRSVA